MPRNAHLVRFGLLRKGFRETEGDHKFYIYFSVAGKKTSVYTKISHGEREISDGNLRKMSRQTHLTRNEFDQLIDCTISQAKYQDTLIIKGKILV